MDSTAERKGKRSLLQPDDLADAIAAAVVPDEEEAEEEEPGIEKPGLVLVAEDGVKVRISEPAARMSQMLRHMMEDGCADGRIPAPNVHSDILEMVVEYCEKHAPYYDPEASERDRYPFPPFPVELTPTVSSIKPVTYVHPDPHGLKDWDNDFISLDNSTLFEIILAANYLNIEDLLDLGTTAVADTMRGESRRRSAKSLRSRTTTHQSRRLKSGRRTHGPLRTKRWPLTLLFSMLLFLVSSTDPYLQFNSE